VPEYLRHRAAVTDTHPLVYHTTGGRGLSARAAAFFKRCESREAIVYVPTAVIWECALLARASRVRLRPNVREFFQDLFSNPAYQPIDLSPDHVFLAEEYRFNRDPFDGLIVASAQTLDLPLISRDAAIQESGAVKIVW
jgi:PIN domain nuclease of toxin-antitoxin system